MKSLISILILCLIITTTLFFLYAIILFCFTISAILGAFMIVFAVLFLFFSIIELLADTSKGIAEKNEQPSRSKFTERLEEAKRIQEQKKRQNDNKNNQS